MVDKKRRREEEETRRKKNRFHRSFPFNKQLFVKDTLFDYQEMTFKFYGWKNNRQREGIKGFGKWTKSNRLLGSEDGIAGSFTNQLRSITRIEGGTKWGATKTWLVQNIVYIHSREMRKDGDERFSSSTQSRDPLNVKVTLSRPSSIVCCWASSSSSVVAQS